ncbi:MAG: IclR family transcriptional regulator [Spirochaetaceae bacterium]
MVEKNSDVPAINKMNLIFNLLASEHNSLSQTAICTKLDLSKATVFRLLNTLVSMGYIEQDEKTGFYSLGAKLLTLGNIVNKRLDLNTVATPLIEKLSDSLDEMVKISIMRGDVVYLLNSAESKKAMRITLDSATVFPPYIGAAAKLLLAMTPEGQSYQLETLSNIKIKKYTDYTVTNITELKKILRVIEDDAVAFDYQEESEGIYAIAAPIYDSRGVVIAAVSIPFFGDYKQKTEKYMPLLKKCAEQISQLLGYHKITE